MSTNKVDLKPQTFLIAHSKGQKISKVNYVVLNSSKKRTKYLPNSALSTRAKTFRSFFGRIENK